MPLLVQSKSGNGSSGTTLTVTLAAGTTAGNCLVVHVGTEESGGGPTVSGITLGGAADNFLSGVSSSSAIVHNEIWTDQNCAGAQTSVVTSLTGGSGSFPNVVEWVEEWSGVLTAAAVDKSSSGTGSSTAFSSGATATTTQASEVIVGSGAAQQTPTGPSSPWTNLAVVSNTNVTTLSMVAGWQVASSTGTFTYSGTLTSGNWAACVLTLKASASAGVAGTVQPRPALPPARRRPARASVRFTPVTTVNAAPAAPVNGTVQPRAALPPARRRRARAVIRFTPVTTTNPAPLNGTVQPRATIAVPRRRRNRAVTRFTPVSTFNALPAVKTLLVSLASAAGVDDYGNPYPQGITAFEQISGSNYTLQLGQQTFGATTAPAFFISNQTSTPFLPPGYTAAQVSASGCGAEIFSGQATAGSGLAVIAVLDSALSGVPGGLIELVAGQTLLNTSASSATPLPHGSITTVAQLVSLLQQAGILQ